MAANIGSNPATLTTPRCVQFIAMIHSVLVGVALIGRYGGLEFDRGDISARRDIRKNAGVLLNNRGGVNDGH